MANQFLNLAPQQSSSTTSPGVTPNPLAKFSQQKLPAPPSMRLAARIAAPRGPKIPNPLRSM